MKILKHVALITNLVWKRYDNDGNGVIDSYIGTLIGDVMAWDGDNDDKPDPYEVKKFLDDIDENGDGELDRDEFGNFVRDGLIYLTKNVLTSQKTPLCMQDLCCFWKI